MADKIHNVAEGISDNTSKVKSFAKSHLFDFIAVGTVISMAALSMGIVELRSITVKEIVNIVLEAIPFYLAAVMLTMTYYTKGTFEGKQSDSYISIKKLYSSVVNSLDGKMLEQLSVFCEQYNDRALVNMQKSILKTVSIPYERFNDFTYDKDGDELKPLKMLNQVELLELYNAEVVNVIISAKKCKVKGISSNILLGTLTTLDDTNIGSTEAELTKRRATDYALYYAIVVILLTLISVKNVLEWGWAGIIMIMFKILYILCRSYMKYFDGYKDITIEVFSYISRKIDILKEYKSWYDERFSEEKEQKVFEER